MGHHERGIRLLSSSSSSSTSSRGGRSNNGDIIMMNRIRGGDSLLPWMIMGVSMGMGYFGLEFLWAMYQQRCNTSGKRAKESRREASPFHDRLLQHVRQMGAMLSLSDAKRWLVRCWTLPFPSYDVICGIFVAALPSSTISQDYQGRLAVDGTSSRALQSTEKLPDEEEGGVFLTLPPQLHAPFPAKTASKPPTTVAQAKKERYLEMLLHNVSHTDLVLGLDILTSNNLPVTSLKSSNESLNEICLCRPRFSAFDMYCRKVLAALQEMNHNETKTSSKPQPSQQQSAEIIMVPQYQRAQNDPRYTIQPTGRPHVATGFCWKQSRDFVGRSKTDSRKAADSNNNPRVIPLTEALADLRVRGKDMAKIIRESGTISPRPTLNGDEEAPTSPTTASWNLVTSALSETTPKATNVPPRRKEEIITELKAVFFPLLATLLPRWHALIAQKYRKQQSQDVQKVLVLVSGVGSPRNWTHSITGNSTQVLADVMEIFLKQVYPDITVVKIHSDTNIFRYDDNILFVQQELLPAVNAYRDAHATQAPYPHELGNTEGIFANSSYMYQLQPPRGTNAAFDVDWKKSFAITLSFADGSPARTHAIQTALRTFRPMYFHIWQLKTFWHERKIVDDDVEVHSFEEMETSPALESKEIQGELAQVVNEMIAFRQEMTETLQKKNASDIHSFWLRKTHKPVLAVLLVQSEGEPPKMYRGTNMEVSMPTGSLCAERNVIGTALASNPRLKRQDLKCIAVLAVPQPLQTSATSAPPRPPRSSSMGIQNDVCLPCLPARHNSVDGSMSSSTITGKQMRRESFDEREEEEWLIGAEENDTNRSNKEGEVVVTGKPEDPGTPVRRISLFSSESSNSLVDMIKQNTQGAGSPSVPRRITQKGSSTAAAVKEKRTVIVRSNNNDIDLNPLRPCGACHEWLKKIAECNPYFQIMTFTDADCNGVYVTPCQE